MDTIVQAKRVLEIFKFHVGLVMKRALAIILSILPITSDSKPHKIVSGM